MCWEEPLSFLQLRLVFFPLSVSNSHPIPFHTFPFEQCENALWVLQFQNHVLLLIKEEVYVWFLNQPSCDISCFPEIIDDWREKRV